MAGRNASGLGKRRVSGYLQLYNELSGRIKCENFLIKQTIISFSRAVPHAVRYLITCLII